MVIEPVEISFISGVDISRFPEIAEYDPTFFDAAGETDDFINILKNNGVNTIRLRLWVNPDNEHSGFEEVKTFAQSLKEQGFKIWICPHFSDTWADPGHQKIPTAWENDNFEQLKERVVNHTEKIITEIEPDFIQIGNEINNGFLFPLGNLHTNPSQFIDLLKSSAETVRANSERCKIILHYAGIDYAEDFFSQLNTVDYDIIGLSFYPIWHGKSLSALKQKLNTLSTSFNKEVLIAETAYPFTLGWNDWTNNIVGLQEQLILSDFPATPEGQSAFISNIKSIVSETEQGIGFCYWGAELIAWKGTTSASASPWENQALFDFNNKALPVLREFKVE